MSVLRAILARFARLLVRLARTLDPGLATAPYWTVPERMAALRQRYPGAPEHWLELVARRAQIGPADEPHGPAARQASPIDKTDAHPAPRPTLFQSFLRRRDRPAMHFAQADARPRRPLGAAESTPSRGPQPQLAPPPAAPGERPNLSFEAQEARNPIANLQRTDRRARSSAMLRFDADPRAPRDAPRVEAADGARSGHPAVFPDTSARGHHGDEPVGPAGTRRDERAQAADARWPEFRHSPLVDRNWPDQPPRAARRDPAFASYDRRWPELPLLISEFGPSPALTRNEAALLAEQIGGAWSE